MLLKTFWQISEIAFYNLAKESFFSEYFRKFPGQHIWVNAIWYENPRSIQITLCDHCQILNQDHHKKKTVFSRFTIVAKVSIINAEEVVERCPVKKDQYDNPT